jgi:hypothetical protein
MASFPVDGHCRDGSVDVECLPRDITCQADVLRSFHGCQGGDCIYVEAPTDNQAGEHVFPLMGVCIRSLRHSFPMLLLIWRFAVPLVCAS